ncbi:hypothetical protein [Chitinimonas naiadis]
MANPAQQILFAAAQGMAVHLQQAWPFLSDMYLYNSTDVVEEIVLARMAAKLERTRTLKALDPAMPLVAELRAAALELSGAVSALDAAAESGTLDVWLLGRVRAARMALSTAQNKVELALDAHGLLTAAVDAARPADEVAA